MKKRFFVGLLTVLCVAGVAVGAVQMPHTHTTISHSAQRRESGPICGTVEVSVVKTADGAQFRCSYEDTMYLLGLVAGVVVQPEAIYGCEAELTIQTDLGIVEVSLKKAFIRTENGQAALTKEQLQKLCTMEAICMAQKWNETRQ
jgi:hypothetical protein